MGVCGRASRIFDAARKLGDGNSPIIFDNERGGQLDGKPVGATAGEGIATGRHSLRSSFCDWATEEADHPREVVEAALPRDQTKAEAAMIRAGWRHRQRLGLPPFDAGLLPFRYAGIRSGLTARMADRAVPVELT